MTLEVPETISLEEVEEAGTEVTIEEEEIVNLGEGQRKFRPQATTTLSLRTPATRRPMSRT